MKKSTNIRVGKPDTSPSLPAHTRGIRQGNQAGNFEKEPGFVPQGSMAKGTARRSTGINPDARNPIDPKMPNLSPP